MKKLFLSMALAASFLYANAADVDTIAIASPWVPTGPVNVIVITPETADTSAQFPTVYLLHGHGNNHNCWYGDVQPRLADLADQYGMVMVMPDGGTTWYWDSPAVPEMKMETFFTQTLVPYIDDNYPTIRDPKKRAITGLSMGGQGALYLGIRHPDIWGNVGSTSGGVDIRPFPKNWHMSDWLGTYAENPQIWDEHCIVNMVDQIKPGQQNFIIDCGVDDFFAECNNDLHQLMLDAKIPHDYIVRPGAHTRQYWTNSILFQLLFFDEAFKK